MKKAVTKKSPAKKAAPKKAPDDWRSETLVGLFVLLGILALVFLALKAANLATFANNDSYAVQARFDNIGGLKVRAPVRSAGVTVGRVTHIGLTRHHRLDKDAGFTGDDEGDLQKLDAYLCDLKEAQIRDGLHILGSSPEGQQETDLLVALTRVPRGTGQASDQSLIRALSQDANLGDFDPLLCDFATVWRGPRPDVLIAWLRVLGIHDIKNDETPENKQKLRNNLAILVKTKEDFDAVGGVF